MSKSDSYIDSFVLQTLLDHSLFSIRQIMMFMPDKDQDKLVDSIAQYRDMVQRTRIPQK